ncbi:MAG: NAD(P)-binding protein [Spirochaetes bacterium]|nr:NAD(P)-binding protein [Spirochaetota bacterium]
MKVTEKNKFDVIVIGSGLSGLAAAGLLTKINKKKVLVLERHYEIGGLTHEFKRGAYSWDIGLHQVGNIEKRPLDYVGKILFDYLTDGLLKWNKMPKIFDKLIFPDFKIEIEESVKGYKKSLLKLFPHEKKTIDRYIKDVHKVRLWYLFYFFSKFFHFPLKQIFKFLTIFNKSKALMTTADYLRKNVKNDHLKAALQARWGNYGIMPEDSAFAIHAVVEHHYYTGSIFPDGGAEKIASLMENTIELYGGKILVSREVSEIILEGKKAVGVMVKNLSSRDENREYYYAKSIISSAGADTTYLKLLPHNLNLAVQKKLKDFPPGYSGMDIYLGLKDSPEKLGIKGENYWIFDGYELDMVSKNHLKPDELKSVFCFLSFPSLKSGKPGGHTADIVTILPNKLFQEWKNEEWKKKKVSYYQLKEKLVESLIKLVDKYIPDFSKLIVYKEIATPLTFEYFTNRKNGLFYGLPAFPERFKIDEIQVKTQIKNLYLTGVDLLSNGILPSLFSAMGTVSYLNGFLGIVKVIVKAVINAPGKKKVHSIIHKESEDKASGILIKKTKTAKHLIELTYEFNRELSFIPGQHIKLLVAIGEWRAYSIAKTDKNKLTLVIDNRPGGTGTTYVENIQPGEKSLFRMPITDMVYHPSERKLMFIATGTGLVPFIHILDELKKANEKKKIIMIFGCMNENEDITDIYLKDYKEYFNFESHTCVENATKNKKYYKGRITDFLNESNYNFREYDLYVCGHPHMTEAVLKQLRSKNADKIYY